MRFVPLQTCFVSQGMQGSVIVRNTRVGHCLPLVVIKIVKAQRALGVTRDFIREPRIVV
jgi:hypothetical protein